MTVELKNEHGKIGIDKEVITTIAGSAASECYGLVGMASQKQIKDGIVELLGRDNQSKGIIVREDDDAVHIDMYIIVSYGTKISEVAHNIQNKVKYNLEQMLGISVSSVNVIVQGVRVTNP